MIHHKLPSITDVVLWFAPGPVPASQQFGYEPTFLRVGQPLRYEFPHLSSSAVPELRPRYTLPAPGYESTRLLASPLDQLSACLFDLRELKWTPLFGQKTSDPSLHPVRSS
jgi:hypothetical protein